MHCVFVKGETYIFKVETFLILYGNNTAYTDVHGNICMYVITNIPRGSMIEQILSGKCDEYAAFRCI
jgi:hypothetical protein